MTPEIIVPAAVVVVFATFIVTLAGAAFYVRLGEQRR
jgi:hypothetical protein